MQKLFQKGDKVQFMGGVIPEQVKFACADYPSHLIVGKTYTIESVDIQKWYTKVRLENKSGAFNSVHFRLLAHE